MILRYFFCLVWMDSHRRINPVVLFSKRQCRIEFVRTWARADGEERRYSCGMSTCEHGFAVFRELREVNVRV